MLSANAAKRRGQSVAGLAEIVRVVPGQSLAAPSAHLAVLLKVVHEYVADLLGDLGLRFRQKLLLKWQIESGAELVVEVKYLVI